MDTWFTSDTHFGHTNILKHDGRPFRDIEEHDEVLIDNWNRVVHPKDIVYHLGDFCFRNTRSVGWYLDRLNGQIHLIRGNHDDKGAWKHRKLFSSAEEAAYLRINGEKIYLSHYACRTWRGSHRGSWHLHGHSHGSLQPCDYCHTGAGKTLDVWIGAHGVWLPRHFETIKVYMNTRPRTCHHEGAGWQTRLPIRDELTFTP